MATQICGQEDSFNAKWRPVATTCSRISGLDEIFGLDEPEPIPINPSPPEPSPLQQPSSSGLTVQNSTPSSIHGNELPPDLTPQHSGSGKNDISPHTSEALSTHDPCTPLPAIPAANSISQFLQDVKSEVVDDDLFGSSSMHKVLKKEIITITTTKIYYLNGKEICKRTKTKSSESNTTIMMTPAELERKTTKPTNRNGLFYSRWTQFCCPRIISLNSVAEMMMREEERTPVHQTSFPQKGFAQIQIEDIKRSPGYMEDSMDNGYSHQEPVNDPSKGFCESRMSCL